MPDPNSNGKKLPAPRYRRTEAFYRALRVCGKTFQEISNDGGFAHLSALSALLHNDFSGTPLTMERLERVARLIGFPVDEIVEPGEPTVFERDDRPWKGHGAKA